MRGQGVGVRAGPLKLGISNVEQRFEQWKEIYFDGWKMAPFDRTSLPCPHVALQSGEDHLEGTPTSAIFTANFNEIYLYEIYYSTILGSSYK